jgi:hypothetical protein
VGALDDEGRTPLLVAADYERDGLICVPPGHGAEDNKGRTVFQIASANGNDEMRPLSEYGANVVACCGMILKYQ